MQQKEFIDRLNLCFKTNKKDIKLLSDEVRFFRAQLLLKSLNSISKSLSLFDFKDNIVFEKNLPFIVLDGIKFLLNHQLFLKHSGKKFVSSSNKTIKFLKHFNIKPKNIIDLGACWGEFSLFLSKNFSDSNIFSIEGSEKNYDVLNINLNHNPDLSKKIKTFNLIISDKDGYEEISDSTSTMNTLKSVINKEEIRYKTIKSNKLETFIMKHNIDVDFIKIDIEGSELKLLPDLKNNFTKSIQIELINYNTIETNLDFLEQISSYYDFYDPKGWTLLNIRNLKQIVKETLKVKPTIDIFMIKKSFVKKS